jgi:hypothetical protein
MIAPMLNRLFRNPWTYLALAGFIQFLALPNGYVGKEHDDALYVMASQALAHGTYRLWFLPHLPAITQATPGFPLFLLPVGLLAPGSLMGYQLLNGLWLMAAGPLLFLWLRPRLGAGTAAAGSVMFSLNPLALSRLGVVMPEPAFLLVVLGVLCLWDRGLTHPAVLGPALLLAYFVRPAGVVLWGGVLIALLWDGRWRYFLGNACVLAAGYGAWSLWCRHGGGGVPEEMELATLYHADRLASIAGTVWANAKSLLGTWGSGYIPLKWGLSNGATWAGMILTAPALAGTARGLRSSQDRPAALFLGGSLGMHLFWPWWYDRYLLPLLAFLIWAAVKGLPKRLNPAVYLAGLTGLSFLLLGWFWVGWRNKSPLPPMGDTYRWINENTGPDDGFMGLFYNRDMLYTLRAFVAVPNVPDEDAFFSWAKTRRVRYILWGKRRDLGYSLPDNALTRYLDQVDLWLENPARARLAFDDPAGGVRLYEVKPAGPREGRRPSPAPGGRSTRGPGPRP